MDLKRILMGIGIALLFVFFIIYSVESFYDSPRYDDYCDRIAKPLLVQEECELNNGTWISRGNETGYCDIIDRCYDDYNVAREAYNRNAFFIVMLLGLIGVVISFYIGNIAVGNGILAGGVFIVIYSMLRYWGDLNDVLRTSAIGVALIVFIWLTYKKLN